MMKSTYMKEWLEKNSQRTLQDLSYFTSSICISNRNGIKAGDILTLEDLDWSQGYLEFYHPKKLFPCFQLSIWCQPTLLPSSASAGRKSERGILGSSKVAFSVMGWESQQPSGLLISRRT